MDRIIPVVTLQNASDRTKVLNALKKEGMLNELAEKREDFFVRGRLRRICLSRGCIVFGVRIHR